MNKVKRVPERTMEQLGLSERLHPSKRDRRDKRTEFERDRARVIHSAAFRRLQGKTQIFPPAWVDFLRTRVTHSIEVAQIGRALAVRFKVPESLVEAACLAHDLGHPPFGHDGEECLDEFMRPYGGFEGNAQTLRVVTRLEEKSRHYQGLDLTRGTLLGTIKYPFARSAGENKFIYDDDVANLEEFLYKGSGYGFVRSPGVEARCTVINSIMDIADDIAYSVHDLEDGIVTGFLRPEEWTSDWFVRSVHAQLGSAPVKWSDGAPGKAEVGKLLEKLVKRLRKNGALDGPPTGRSAAIRETSRFYVNRFANAANLVEIGPGATVFDFKVKLDEGYWKELQVLKAITFAHIIEHERTRTFMRKGRHVLTKLFSAMKEEAVDRRCFKLFSSPTREALENVVGAADQVERQRMRIICDHLASLTEGEAMALYARMFESTGGSPLGRSI
jgi:dGTPase